MARTAVGTGAEAGKGTAVPVDPATEALFPGNATAGTLETVSLGPGAAVVLRDAGARLVVLRLSLGRGAVYYQAAEQNGRFQSVSGPRSNGRRRGLQSVSCLFAWCTHLRKD